METVTLTNVPMGDGETTQQTPSTSPSFQIIAPDSKSYQAFYRKDPYSAAMSFLSGNISIEGDLVAAIRDYWAHPHARLPMLATAIAARINHSLPARWLSHWRNHRANIQFHYDQSNPFYELFLDPWMQYSCAYFQSSADNLAQAQEGKMELISRKLSLKPGERVLDIGCGWGGLLRYMALKHQIRGEGYTLSSRQASYARSAIQRENLEDRLSIIERDYRFAQGPYNKIVSVGMFEHLGKDRLDEYFRKVYAVLAEDGLFLNHGIMRPDNVAAAAETLFLDRHVFPGADLVPLTAVVKSANNAGFEVLDVENLRPHYALTCRHWVNRLQAEADRCRDLVGEVTYRTWLLYLAACAVSFEDGYTEIHQVLLAKRGSKARTWLTRRPWYVGSSSE